MARVRLLPALALVVALALVACGGDEDDGGVHLEDGGIVFTAFEGLPNGACPGLFAVDARSREIFWLVGYRERGDEFALYPAFTAGGKLAHAYIVDRASEVPLADVHVGNRHVARALLFFRPLWSPTREELAYTRFEDGRADVVVKPLVGHPRVVARGATLDGWFPDGERLLYTYRKGNARVTATVGRDGSDVRELLRDADLPILSPDGRRVAYLRMSSTEVELWLKRVDGGGDRRLLGPAPLREIRPMLWSATHELLVQSGGRHHPHFDAGEELHLLDVDTGEDRLFLERAFAVSLSPDRERLLFARLHGTETEYFSLHTVRLDGSDEQLLTVTDEEDFNAGSVPVWAPAGTRLEPFGDEQSHFREEECVERLTSARDRVP